MGLATDNYIFLYAILLIIGVLTTKFSSRLGLPSLVLYIIVGMFLNRFIYYDNAYLTQLFGILALIVILFEGGMQTRWDNVRPILLPSFSLATMGVLITTTILGVFAKYILGLNWLEGMLFGAIVSSTDAAAVFAVIGNKNIKQRLTSTLEVESGTNDPMAIFLTISLIQIMQIPETNIFSIIGALLLQIGIGALAGILFGKIAIWSINKINLDSSGLYPVLTLAFALFTYSATALLNGSGLLAVYIMAVLIGNSDLTYRHSIVRFNEGFAWMMQILMFILLGLLVFPNELIKIGWQGLILSLLLMLVARPIGVFLSTFKMGYSLRDKTFIAWSGLKGAVPIVLATYPMIAGLENSQLIFNVVFFVVLTSALIQGASITPLANALGLAGVTKITTSHSLELVSMGKTNTEIIELAIEEGAQAINKQIHQLVLPEDSLVTAIIRKDKVITPKGNTSICEGDTLYILVNKKQREVVKRVFSEV